MDIFSSISMSGDTSIRPVLDPLPMEARTRETILGTVATPILARDLSGRMVFANQAAALYLGFPSVEALMAAPTSVLADRFSVTDENGLSVPPEDFLGMLALRGKAATGVVLRIQDRTDGRSFWSSVNSTPIPDGLGRIRLAITDFHDITALKQAQLDLGRSRDEMDAILRAANYGVIAMDGEGRGIYANPAAARQHGYANVEDLLAAPLREILARHDIHDKDGKPVPAGRRPASLALKGERAPEELYCHRLLSTGEVSWSLSWAVPVPDAEGRVRLVLYMMQDVTALKQAQNELSRSRDELDVILRTMDSGCTAQDPSGRIVFANRAAASLLGFDSPEDLLGAGGRAALDRFEPIDAAGMPFPLERLPGRLALRGQAVIGEVIGYRVRATGQVRWSIVNGTPVFDAQGQVRLAINVFHDITPVKLAEEALRTSEMTDRKAAEEAQRRHVRHLECADAIARASEQAMDTEKVLPAALEKVLQVMDCGKAMLLHPADPDALDFRIPFAVARGSRSLGEMHLPRESAAREIVCAVLEADGPVAFGPGDTLPQPRFWLDTFEAGSLLAMSVRPRAGKPWLLCLLRSPGEQPWSEEEKSLFRDIGSRITAALGNMLLYRDLRRSEEKYRTLFERSLDGVFRCAPDGTVLDANPALVALLGCSGRAEIVGDIQRQLLPSGGGAGGSATRGDPFIVEIRRKDGGKVWAEVIAQSILRSDGEVACYEGMVRNIDDRKRTEEALRENEDALRQAQKMEAVGRLAGGVAHDFNNLLTAINGFGDLLLMQVPKDDPRRMHVEEIRKAGERAAGLTGQLLAFSRKQVLEPRHLDLNTVVSGMEPMLRRLIGENIVFVTRLEPDLPRVLADPNQAEQIIMNLALNARDAMPTGGELCIATGTRRLEGGRGRALVEVQNGDYVMLTVSDTGTGMDEATKARLFEPFFTTKDKDKGTGLGLSMVYGAVKQGNGSIEVDTRPSHGTCFRVLLPAAGKGETVPVKARPTGKLSVGVRGTETILLVEDEDAVRRLVRDVLQFGGYKVLEAPGGERALEAAARHEGPIHLLLTDVVMAGMSGRELAERLCVNRPDTRILYMSGYTEDAIIRHGIQAAQTAFIGKPFTPVALAAKVREVLSGPVLAAEQGPSAA